MQRLNGNVSGSWGRLAGRPSRRRGLGAAVAALLWSLTPVALADLGAGVAAIERGDYEAAVAELTPLAEQDNAVALSYLGWMYDQGKGVARDPAKAAALLERAAELGESRAQFVLGVKLMSGRGVTRDESRGSEWLHAAARQGHPGAQALLGELYMLGNAVPKSYVEAYAWFSVAVTQGLDGVSENLEVLEAVMNEAQRAEADALARRYMEEFGGGGTPRGLSE